MAQVLLTVSGVVAPDTAEQAAQYRMLRPDGSKLGFISERSSSSDVGIFSRRCCLGVSH